MRLFSITLACIFALSLVSVAQSPKARKKYDQSLVELERRRPDRAEKSLQDAVADSPDWAAAYAQLGIVEVILRHTPQALEVFARMRDLDSKNHSLTQEQRREGMDMYGVTLARTKRYDEAIEVYTAAIKDDPDFGQFEYNLACTYSEQGNLDKAIPHLKRAWTLRNTFRFPDPRQDSSFKRWLDDPRFQKAVENMVI